MSVHGVPSTKADRLRRVRALLAGGLVLGLGAAGTLAAWTDSEFATGVFTSGQFNIQGNVTGSTETGWHDYDTPPGGNLAFTVAPSAMTPGQSVYAPLNLRVGPEASNYDASVTVAGAPAGPTEDSPADAAFFNALMISLYNVPPAECNAADITGFPLGVFDDTKLTTISAAEILHLKGDTTPEGVCFKVTLSDESPSLAQGGATGPLTWRFHVESVDPAP